MFNLKNKRVAVFGMGVSGLSALRFVKALDGQLMAINGGDVSSWAKPDGVLKYIELSKCFNENDLILNDLMREVDLVILSPGIPRDHAILKSVLENKIPVWGEIELAYQYLKFTDQLSKLIGITGTNGKTTTTTFLGEMIKADKKEVFVGGNIGVPFCDYAYELLNKKIKKADFILLELSSFQLESIEHFHVDIAMILNLFQNHGERYETIEEYGRSKFFISNHFTKEDLLLFPVDFPIVNDWAQKQICRKIGIDTRNPKIDFDITAFKLPGVHNKVNLAFICQVASEIGLSQEAINYSIKDFGGVHHRIEYVKNVLGLPAFSVFNDAKSTNWDATLTAIKAMEDFHKPIHLIIGGKKRGHGDSILPHLDAMKKNVYKFYLIGEMADEIEEEIKNLVNYEKTNTLEETFKSVRKNYGDKEGVLLFSPGFPSFDQFLNYAERGEFFISMAMNPTK
jgi:UDP-N-acetylmuramoylalanine--D-glutamate ligase